MPCGVDAKNKESHRCIDTTTLLSILEEFDRTSKLKELLASNTSDINELMNLKSGRRYDETVKEGLKMMNFKRGYETLVRLSSG